MRKRPRRVTIYDPIYDTDILLFLGGSRESAERTYNRMLLENVGIERVSPADNGPSKASVLFVPGFKGLAIWFADTEPGSGIVAHECLHATSHILRESGIEHTAETEEVYAYHLEWLVKSIGRRVQRR